MERSRALQEDDIVPLKLQEKYDIYITTNITSIDKYGSRSFTLRLRGLNARNFLCRDLKLRECTFGRRLPRSIPKFVWRSHKIFMQKATTVMPNLETDVRKC